MNREPILESRLEDYAYVFLGTGGLLRAARRETYALHRNLGSIILIGGPLRSSGQPLIKRLRPTSSVGLQLVDSLPWMGLFLAAPIQPLESIFNMGRFLVPPSS